MRQCWSEGALRAYLDRELPPEDMERAAAHLGECPWCEARRAELAGRAARVSGFMNVLPEPGPVTSLPLITRRPRTTWQWAAALAAAVVMAFVLAPKRVVPVSSGAPVQSPSVQSGADALVRARPPGRAPAPANTGSPVQSTAPRHSKRQPAEPRATADYYLALDDEPIETGVVMRVALGPAEVPADVIFDQEGRARAIRLSK
jgi:anti-sigma factor RsiW